MAETAAWLVDRVIPKVPVRQWVLSFPIPLRSLFAVHPELLAPVLQIIHRVIATHLIRQTGVKRSEAATGAVTLIQRFGSAANLNIHLHALVVGGEFAIMPELVSETDLGNAVARRNDRGWRVQVTVPRRVSLA